MRRWLTLALAAAAGCGSDHAPSSENLAREAYVAQLATREGVTGEWRLASRGDLVFEEGWSRMVRVEPELALGSSSPVPIRWIGPSAHARIRGRSDMQLRIWGRVDRAAIFTRPRVSLMVAGIELASRLVADDGSFVVETVVPATWVTGWTELYLSLSSVGEPWRDPAVTKVARVEGVVWEAVR